MTARAVELAEDAIGVGDLDGAIAILERHLLAAPHDAEARELLASARDARLPPGPTYGDLRADTRHLEPAAQEPARAGASARPAPPLGVAILAGLNVTTGAVIAILGVVALLAGAVAGLLFILAGAAIVGVGVALWRLRTWAWLLELALNAVGIFANLFRMGEGAALAAVGLLLNVVVIVYLVRVGRFFGAASHRARGEGAGAG